MIGDARDHVDSFITQVSLLRAPRAMAEHAVRSALDAPLARIADNAGFEGRVVVAKVRDLGQGQGFNAATGEFGDLAAQGVIDPVKVTKAALGNAASIAGLVSKAYAASQRARIDPARAAVSEGERHDRERLAGQIGEGHPAQFVNEQTTHFACADAEGTVVSVTQTLGMAFGSGFADGFGGVE